MALTTLDPVVALVVIDLQKGIVAVPTEPIASDVVVSRATALAEAFRGAGQPVVIVNVAGAPAGRNEAPKPPAPPADWAELVPGLAQPGDHRVTKRTWGAFTGTNLADWLNARGATQVVLCGISTSIGVESTARQAHELGLNVVLVVDAMADRFGDGHARSLQRIFPRLGETATTEEIVARLAAREPIP